MANLFSTLRRSGTLSLDDYANLVSEFGLHQGFEAFTQTLGGQTAEPIGNSFTGYVTHAYKSNAIVAACELTRLMLFAQVRFAFRQRNRTNGRPGDLFHNPRLRLLDEPWPGGTTSDLLARMIQDADFGGNAYLTVIDGRVHRMRPDWVSIILGSDQEPDDPDIAMDSHVLGFFYDPPGRARGRILLPEEVAHFAPEPDPLANYRGMSWLTPVLREVRADGAMTKHQSKFFDNAAPQPLDAGVLTPSGWASMGDMRVGSQVIGSDGRPHHVVGVYPQGEQEVWRVTFADGSSTECSADHVWTVTNAYDRRRGVTRTMSLSDLVGNGLHYDSGTAKWAVPMVDPVEFAAEVELPVEPYLMGLLLGDGSFRGNGKGSGGVSLSCQADDTDETVSNIEPVLPDGVSITCRDRGGWSEFYFRGRGGPTPNPLTQRVRDLGLFDVDGTDKWIPDCYLLASVKDRVALLQGLIDSDGHIGETAVRYTTTSRRLADGLVDLVGSLGGAATIRPNKGRRTITVLVKQLPDWVIPARLLRKAEAYTASSALRWRTIVSAAPVRTTQTQCIRVDVGDQLYVTDGYVLTHNTPNLAIKYDATVESEKVKRFIELFKEQHEGLHNAHRTLHLGGGADPTVIGKDFKEMDFRATRAAGEDRIAAAAGVHPTIVGITDGLAGSSLNEGNFQAARRLTADRTLRWLWGNAAASLSQIVRPPANAELWYDGRDVPFLQEDEDDAAEIQSKQAQTIRTLTDAGYTPESVIAAVTNSDMTLLTHSQLYSVQLQPAGSDQGAGRSHGNGAGDPQRAREQARELAEGR